MKILRLSALLLCLLAPALRAEVVVVVHPKSAITSLSKEQVAQIYLGRAETLQPIERIDDPALRGEFYARVAGRSLAQVKAVWSKLIFTGRASPPLEVRGAASVRRAVAADINAIGYLDAADVDASVRPVVIQ